MILFNSSEVEGTGIRTLMRGMATLLQGNQELLVVRDKVGRPPGGLGVSKSVECGIFFLSVLWHCWFGDRKGIRPVKNWMMVCWWWWFDWSFARLIALEVKLSPPHPSSFASINTGQPRFTWKIAVKTETERERELRGRSLAQMWLLKASFRTIKYFRMSRCFHYRPTIVNCYKLAPESLRVALSSKNCNIWIFICIFTCVMLIGFCLAIYLAQTCIIFV